MTPDLPGSPPEPDRLSSAARELLLWIGRLLLWTGMVLGALFIGGPLALYGLAGLALAAALALVALGVFAWRRAMLPLALCAGAIAGPAAVVAGQPERIDPSHGMLLVTPRTAAEVQPEYRRGRGPVIVDLRQLQAKAGTTIRFAARSDTGRVVVALPQNQCFNLQVHVRALATDRSDLVQAALVPASEVGLAPTGTAINDLSGAYRSRDWGGTYRPSVSNLVAFGRTTPAIGRGVGSSSTNSWIAPRSDWFRQAPDPKAVPTLRLDLASASNVYVRDYPDDVGVASDSYLGEGYPGQQTSDVHWPEQVELPPSPEQLNASDAWGSKGRTAWHATRERIIWNRWFAKVAVAAQAQSRRAAGPCATAPERASYWTAADYGGQNGSDTNMTELAVNGTGRVRRYASDANGNTVLRSETDLATFVRTATDTAKHGGSNR